ncbi:NAD(P)-dependent dehydrogenase, short-chain alcohol dehydrogenase family [Poseidonocella pacifica]|uniref:NAD(P)-dependent dehydrogenase, short-chain alcohol dehydrogenase family n=1 Tax=Poseidonocella pacifica TaxID=871651 RepID=A0A1I0YYV0_9RHOB|nr:SDR family oxidoreductase [Poseidonocella pacifica]SFB17223.1 NAD(P)-dependent dehydrogenase, short-chain alcohol dehydrogenase family [Poseidonocella pacifica]
MDLGLKGLRALVTGGSKGIGLRCAEILAAEGAAVSICARMGADVDAAVAKLKASGATAHGAVVDVSNKHALEAWVAEAAETLGGIDIVIGNVSALAVADDEDAWKAGFETDMMHSVRLVNAAMPWLEKSEAASITLVSSVSGREIDFTGPAYGAFKAAIVHYAQGLAYKLAAQGIRANTVSPGNTYFDGGIWQNIQNNMPELYAEALSLNPTGRMAKPEEIARGVVFLASPASSFTTGTNLVIDGALTKGVQL